MSRDTCSLVGLFCCGMICIGIYVSLELIVALGVVGLKELNWCPSSASSCCTSRNLRNAAGKSTRDRIGPVGPWLFPLVVHDFSYRSRSCRVATWSSFASSSHRLQALQSIRCSSASFDRFHTSESDEGLIRILSCAPFSSNPSLGSVLVGPHIDHDEHTVSLRS